MTATLAFDLERGRDEPTDAPPVVWRPEEPLTPGALARRFADEWAAWYGPGLAGSAALIGLQLDAAARRAAAGCGTPLDTATAPVGWVLPVVRRRRRWLTIDRLDRVEAPAGPLRLRVVWGALSPPDLPSGQVAWHPCALQEHLDAGPGARAIDAPVWRWAQRLRGGVGLVVVDAVEPLAG